MADRRPLPRWARWTALGCSLAVMGAATYLVVDAMPSQAATAGLRTATVSTGSVTQTVSLSGSVERVDEVTAAFRTAGTVTSVRVAVGDHVEAGEVLATIDTAGLKRAVTVAQANLVAAQAALDAAGSSSTASASSASSSSSSSSASSSSSSATRAGSGSTPSVSASAARPSPSRSSSPARGVDTSGVHAAVSGYDALVQAAVTTCQPVTGSAPVPTPTPSPSPSPSGSASPSPSPPPSGSPSTGSSIGATPAPTASTSAARGPATVEPVSLSTGSTEPTPEQVGACVQALSAALTSAQRTASEMDRLAKELDAAAKALQQQQSQAATQGSTGQSRGGTASGTSAAGATRSTGSAGAAGVGGSGGGSQSTATLEVAVLKATQTLAGAQQDLGAAVLEAPISGTVGRVDLVKGEQAGTSAGVVVVGPGSAVVTVDVPLAQLGKVRVAQDVVVTPAGTTEQLPGLVQSIGVLPTSSTASTPTYPVRITVSDAPVTLAAGSTATATITLATVTDVLTVPVSAVTGVSSGTGSVQVVSGGTVKATTVTVGAVGQGSVQVEKGLTAGEVVVLADPSTPLPTNTIGLRRSTTGGVSSLTGRGGGFGGRPGG